MEPILSTPPVSKPGHYLAFDCETYLITPENPTPKLVSVQLSQGGESTVFGADTESLAQGVGAVVEALEQGHTIIAHNGFYDWAVILNALGWPEELGEKVLVGFGTGQLRDTLVRAKLHAIEQGTIDEWRFSLADLAQRYCGESIDGKHGPDVWRLRYAELDGIPAQQWPLEAYSYARMDPVWVERVYDAMGVAAGHFHDEAFQTCKTWCLYLAGVWGIRVNPDSVAALEAKLQPIIDEAVGELLKTGVYKRERTVNKHKVAEWLRSLGVKVPVTATGAPSFAAKVLDEAGRVTGLSWVSDKQMWADHAPDDLCDFDEPKRDMQLIVKLVKEHFGDQTPLTEGRGVKTDRETISQVPALRRLADIGEYQKLGTTYFPAMKASKTNILHPRHDPLKATGRNSVSAPNLNNQPKMEGVRECYEARDGYIMCSADYSQAELCSLAQVNLDLFGFSVMAEKINAGVDLHTYLATNVFGVDYDDLKKAIKAGDASAKKKRQNMKAPNFGFPGGMGLAKFLWVAQTQYGIEDVDLETVSVWKQAWLDTWPEMAQYFALIGTQTQGGRKFTAIQHRSGRRRGNCGYCDGANTFFQGLTADGAGAAVIAVTHEAYFDKTSPLYGARIIALIYDELLVEWPDRGPEHNTAAAKRLVDIMEQSMQLFTPDVKATVEPALMRRWSKKADPVWKDGLLYPWEDR
jgi:DNA polymerase I